MLSLFRSLSACATLVLVSGASLAQTGGPASRGQLLYDTHCVACHDKQVHWRASGIVTSWAGLVAQVRRWQTIETLQWTESDITQVARHLNATIYHYPLGDLAQRE